MSTPAIQSTVRPSSRQPQARSAGTGYGRSSGYAAPRSYAGASPSARFRVA
ncbi:hypothetical protein QFW77_09800 [Luteimonas sp. RD2P54]|uniref:Uncharacterized protein n=1 Tax=Luteimonas endophytica TaxID=3042023 RepID=A0ABT6J8Z7_9GAMM|nr:hypothetical protein [Luteimonas endophytica]MDH5823276.1 hypothetical protein [Luteimonas endophytica]